MPPGEVQPGAPAQIDRRFSQTARAAQAARLGPLAQPLAGVRRIAHQHRPAASRSERLPQCRQGQFGRVKRGIGVADLFGVVRITAPDRNQPAARGERGGAMRKSTASDGSL